MKQSYCSLCLFLLVALFTAVDASAEEGTKNDVRYVGRASLSLCSKPGGPRDGELFRGAAVTVREKSNDWVFVDYSGWVKEEYLSTAKPVAIAPAVAADEGVLSVQSLSTKTVTQGVARPRIYLNLVLKNSSSQNVYSWRGLVVGLNTRGDVLFRERVVAEKSNIPAGGTGTSSFYWENHENAFAALAAATPETLKIELYQVTVNR